MATLIDDFDLIQGDTSKVFFLGLPDSSVLDANWTCRYTIHLKRGDLTPIVDRILPKNTGGEITTYPVGTRFVFQILASESALLEVGTKYEVSVQITNTTLEYNKEVIQFRLKSLSQGVI